jgi:hypothetical protein
MRIDDVSRNRCKIACIKLDSTESSVLNEDIDLVVDCKYISICQARRAKVFPTYIYLYS